MSLNISDFSCFFFFCKIATPPEKSYLLSAIPSQSWDPVKPPPPPALFENLAGVSTPLAEKQKGRGVHTMKLSLNYHWTYPTELSSYAESSGVDVVWFQYWCDKKVIYLTVFFVILTIYLTLWLGYILRKHWLD